MVKLQISARVLRSENSEFRHVDADYRKIRFSHYKDNANIFEIHYIHFI